MAQVLRFETQVAFKTSPEKFFEFFKKNTTRLPQFFPDHVKVYEIVGGGGELKPGSVVRAQYSLVAGSPAVAAKAKVQELDTARKVITFIFLEGDVLQVYKSFKAELQVGAGYAKWTFEVEKKGANSPNPSDYLQFVSMISKGLDSYLCK